MTIALRPTVPTDAALLAALHRDFGDPWDERAFATLQGIVLAERARAARRVPVFLKLAPDLEQAAMDEIAAVIAATDLDGLIVSNTTISREMVAGLENAGEAGGLSGKPLFALATQRLAQLRQRVGALPIIGVGGIHSPQSALAKFEAGADAIQLYSALVFKGPGLVAEIKAGLASQARRAGLPRLTALIGRDAAAIARGEAL